MRNFFGYATLVTMHCRKWSCFFQHGTLAGHVQVGDYAVMVGSQRSPVLPDRTVCHNRRLLKNCPGCSAFHDSRPATCRKSAALICWPGAQGFPAEDVKLIKEAFRSFIGRSTTPPRQSKRFGKNWRQARRWSKSSNSSKRASAELLD